MSLAWGGPQVNKFEQVWSWPQNVTSREMGVPVQRGPSARGFPVWWGPMHHGQMVTWTPLPEQNDKYLWKYFTFPTLLGGGGGVTRHWDSRCLGHINSRYGRGAVKCFLVLDKAWFGCRWSKVSNFSKSRKATAFQEYAYLLEILSDPSNIYKISCHFYRP